MHRQEKRVAVIVQEGKHYRQVFVQKMSYVRLFVKLVVRLVIISPGTNANISFRVYIVDMFQ